MNFEIFAFEPDFKRFADWFEKASVAFFVGAFLTTEGWGAFLAGVFGIFCWYASQKLAYNERMKETVK
ncbi:MAG: hypothetical protein LBR31_07905 [Desulfovibrio sp.]|jgi:nicotinamide riboside transporter PnuC|nr:hypothetical protein [Desulfovibrio sp.]